MVLTASALLAATVCSLRAAEPVFVEEEGSFSFETSILSGSLKGMKQSPGLTRVIDRRTGEERAHSVGLFTLYRVFDRTTRYEDGRNRVSNSRLLPNGAVEYVWQADDHHPFEMRAVYQWADEQSLDFTLSVSAGKDLKDFEAFLSTYVNGSDRSFVYAGEGSSQWVEALKPEGTWHLFARDENAAAIVLDGRWKREPHPVEWVMRPHFTGALGLRRNTGTGSTTLVMAHPLDCFAVSTPYGNESHRSLYLSLFGRDIKAGQTDTARARLVLGHDLSDDQAVDLYRSFIKERENSLHPLSPRAGAETPRPAQGEHKP